MVIYSRKYNFMDGTTIDADQVDEEFDQLIGGLNQHNIDIANAQTAAINFTKGFGVGDVAKALTDTNLNNIDVGGFYYGSGLTNNPTGYTTGYIVNIKQNTNTRQQIFYANDTTKNITRVFMRFQLTGTWQGWIQTALMDPKVTAQAGDILYSGFSSMTGSVVITPSAALDQCPNGWVIRWDDNPGGGNIFYQHIQKDCAKGSDIYSPIQPIGGGVTPTMGFKRLKITNTTINGHDYNIQGNNTGRALVEVKAY